MDKAKSVKASDIISIGSLACAIIVLSVLIVRGHLYTNGCLKAGKEYEKCWFDGLNISGMGPGGPLGPGVVFGYIIGVANKEKEKREMYRKGYWTMNPDLRPPTSDDPNPS